MPVPFFDSTMDLEDIHSLAGGHARRQDFVCVGLKALDEIRWLEKALKVPSRWWTKHQAVVPLLQEMRQGIDKGKVRKGVNCRMPRRPNAVVAIDVRGKVIFVQNKSGLTLASRPDQEEHALRWFLREVGRDVEVIQQALREEEAGGVVEAETDPQVKKRCYDGGPLADDEEKAFIEDALSQLRAHPQCAYATFLPSRHCFRVVRRTG